MKDLASNVMEKLPRVQADVLNYTGTAQSMARINRGTDHRLFPAMRLCFYTYGDHYGEDSRTRNVYLKKIGQARIEALDRQFSRVYPQPDRRRVENGLMAITK
jgi:hypothetical protein